MWNKPAASLLLGMLLLVGCSNNNANEPLNTKTPPVDNVKKGTDTVKDSVQNGVNGLQKGINKGVNEAQEGVDKVVPDNKVIKDTNDTTVTETAPDGHISNDKTGPNAGVVQENVDRGNNAK